MKQVKLSITETYVSHWDYWQGIRELLQNAIDTKNYTVEFGEDNVRIISRGGKVPLNALLLGKTTKADDSSTIGKFGEGMKLGFLVLKRLGATISMNNAGDTWSPEMVFDEAFGENVLAVNIEEGSVESEPDTVEIIVGNLPPEVIQEVKGKFAPAQNRSVVIENSRGKAYVKDGNHKSCRLFVRGIFVCDVQARHKFKFDYDFMPEAFVLDRDRDTVNVFEVKYEAAKLIQGSDDILLLAELATESYDDLEEFRGSFESYSRNRTCSYGDDEETLASKAVQIFQDKNGYNAFPVDNTWDSVKKRVATQQAIKAGYLPVEVNHALFTMIESEYHVTETLQELVDFDALTFLKKFLDKHRRKMYSKTIKELENTIELLKAIKGDK